MDSFRPLTLLAAVSLLGACASVGEQTSPVLVNVSNDAQGCRVRVDAERVSVERLLQVGRRSLGRKAIVVYAKDTPYKCVGMTIYTLQRAGLASVEVAMWDDG